MFYFQLHFNNIYWFILLTAHIHIHQLILFRGSIKIFTCYRPHICIPTEFSCWSPNLKCEDIWRCVLWEETRSWVWSPPKRMNVLIWDRFFLSLCHVRTQGNSHLKTRGRLLARTQPCWYPDLRLPACRTVRNEFLFFEAPGLRHSVIAAQADLGPPYYLT